MIQLSEVNGYKAIVEIGKKILKFIWNLKGPAWWPLEKLNIKLSYDSVPPFSSFNLDWCSPPSDDLTLDRCSLVITLVGNREEGGRKKDFSQHLTGGSLLREGPVLGYKSSLRDTFLPFNTLS